MRTFRRAGCAGLVAFALTACGGAASRVSPLPAEILGVPVVGSFYGRCADGASRWTLTFVADRSANDLVDYRLGTGRVHRANVVPGGKLAWSLTPGAFRSREPADPISGHPSTSVLTTTPLNAVISQGTEPHIFRVDVHLALAAAIDGTADCAPVSTQLRALTYFNGS
jgi:hypothetical protein